MKIGHYFAEYPRSETLNQDIVEKDLSERISDYCLCPLREAIGIKKLQILKWDWKEEEIPQNSLIEKVKYIALAIFLTPIGLFFAFASHSRHRCQFQIFMINVHEKHGVCCKANVNQSTKDILYRFTNTYYDNSPKWLPAINTRITDMEWAVIQCGSGRFDQSFGVGGGWGTDYYVYLNRMRELFSGETPGFGSSRDTSMPWIWRWGIAFLTIDEVKQYKKNSSDRRGR